jgi:hypothetical protein
VSQLNPGPHAKVEKFDVRRGSSIVMLAALLSILPAEFDARTQ